MYFCKKKILIFIKFLIRGFFKIIHGKITVASKITNNNDIQITKLKIKNKKYYLFKVKDGKIYTDYIENVAIIKSNKILDKISFQQISGKFISTKYNSVLKNGTPRFLKKFNGNLVSLVQGASANDNYFHWMFDVLPKLYMLSKMIKLSKIDYFYVPDTKEYQLFTLSKFKIFNDKIINSKNYRHITADYIFASSHPWYEKGYILKEAKKLPSWVINWVYKKFIIYKKKFRCNSKIFIDRSESSFKHSQIINNEEIKKLLKKKGFSIYKPGQLSIPHQIYLFNNAKIIIGAHGAAFANLVFCKSGTRIIELMSNHHPNTVSKTISKTKKLKYKMIRSKFIKNKNEGDIFLPTNILEKYI